MATRVAINGAAGRMGRELIIACARHDDVELAAAFDAPGSEHIGSDAGMLAMGEHAGVTIVGSEQRRQAQFDVLIDFTRPEPCMTALDDCVALDAAMVIGTTGFDDAQSARIDEAGQSITIVQAPNMSAGVNLMLKLLETAAKALGDSVDVEVIEAHHRHKVDAPSGTALKIGEVLADALGRNLDECAVFAREGHTGERERSTIGFQTIRGGDIVGEHTVLFAGDGERLEITHKASSRQTFASGAMRAASWACAAAPGRYGMDAVLGLD